MCKCIEGTTGETIDITFTFTDANNQPLDLSVYETIDLQVNFQDEEEDLRNCSSTGVSNNMVLQSFTLGEIPGRRKMRFKLTKPNGEFRYYDACHYLIK